MIQRPSSFLRTPPKGGYVGFPDRPSEFSKHLVNLVRVVSWLGCGGGNRRWLRAILAQPGSRTRAECGSKAAILSISKTLDKQSFRGLGRLQEFRQLS